MKNIELKEINHYYGKEQVLHDINISIKEGEFFTLLGPSGCGKTTILRIIGGFIKPLSGSIYVDDKDITNLDTQLLSRDLEKEDFETLKKAYLETMEKILKIPEISDEVRDVLGRLSGKIK